MDKNDFISISWRSPTKITRNNILRHLKRLAPKYASGKLADLGCGVKPYHAIFEPFIKSYLGVDFAAAAEKNYGENTKADIYADCIDTKLESEIFDTILSTQVLEHISDPEKYVGECYRLLKRGGIGIFTIPFLWPLHSEPFDYYRFTKYALEKLFMAKGFDIIELGPMEGAYAALIQAKIISVYMRSAEKESILRKIHRRMAGFFLVPFLNFKALYLDNLFWNDKLCLNYYLVVRKKQII